MFCVSKTDLLSNASSVDYGMSWTRLFELACQDAKFYHKDDKYGTHLDAIRDDKGNIVATSRLITI